MPNKNITKIRCKTIWEKSLIATGIIVIKKNQILTIKKDLIIPENGIIYLEKNSKIIIDGGRIYSPSKNWKGIVKVNFKKRTHPYTEIELLNNGEIVY